MLARPIRGFVVSLLLLAGIALSLVLLVGRMGDASLADLRSRAWSGVTANIERLGALRRASREDINPVHDRSKEDVNSQRKLFHSLTRTYPTAQVQNIDDPAAGIAGVAFLAFDEQLGKTFVFARIENLPLPTDTFIRFWLVRNVAEYQKAGIAEVYREAGVPVTYVAFVRDGDLGSFEKLLVSYDTDIAAAAPQLPVLSLAF